MTPDGPTMPLLAFPAFGDARGRLAFLEGRRHVPFAIRGVEWWRAAATPSDVKDAAADDRVLYAVAGTVRVGIGRATFLLDRPDRGLEVPRDTAWALLSASDDAVIVCVHGRTADAESNHGTPLDSVHDGDWLPSVDDARVVPLQVPSGSTRVGNGGTPVPFPIARLYYLFDVPAGQTRGAHAHRELRQLIVAPAGSFDLRLNDGERERVIRLDRPDVGVLVPRMLWRDLEQFSAGAVCLVLASLPYDEADYIRDYQEYVANRSRRE